MPRPVRVIIEGQTKDGKTFRPSDWSERLGDLLAYFGPDQRIRYSPLLMPVIRDGLRCVAMDTSLQATRPDIYNQIMTFAESNRLNVFTDDTGPVEHRNAA